MTRYQDCSWLVRRWRDRWLLLVPYWYALSLLRNSSSDRPLPIDVCWSLARGTCDVQRHYFYTYDELERMLDP